MLILDKLSGTSLTKILKECTETIYKVCGNIIFLIPLKLSI